jgi:hypothetical protein
MHAGGRAMDTVEKVLRHAGLTLADVTRLNCYTTDVDAFMSVVFEYLAPRSAKMLKPNAVFLWRKVDNPGHDSCCLFKLADGWRLSGASVFCDEGRPCRFSYEVSTDADGRREAPMSQASLARRESTCASDPPVLVAGRSMVFRWRA